ncbi:MAG: CgeB family protein [Desulfovibrionaceae bacterium]
MNHKVEYDNNGEISEIFYEIDGVLFPLLENNGKRREYNLYEYAKGIAGQRANKSIAVFLGMGSCEAIKQYSNDTETLCIVVDDTGLVQEIGIQQNNIHYVESMQEDVVKQCIENIMKEKGVYSIFSVMHPFYARRYKETYRGIKKYIDNFSVQNNAISKSTWKNVRILFLGSACFIRNEFIKAAKKEGIEHSSVILPNVLTAGEYKKILSQEYSLGRPNFILTTNHTCFDRNAIFSEIIESLSIPVASYFMDNPYLDIEKQPERTRKYTSVFTYDADTVKYIKSCLFENVYYLPLGTDTERFTPGKNPRNSTIHNNIVGFLGSSHQAHITRHAQYLYPSILREKAQEISLRYKESADYIPCTLLKREYPQCYNMYKKLDKYVMREYEQYIIYLATYKKREENIMAASILPITVSGDTGWNSIKGNKNIRLMEGISYAHAQYFYRQMEILLNSVCTQMKNAVNQRVFDVPATGTFVLTEYTEQIENVFDIGKEIICYKNKEELQEYLLYYHKNESERRKIVAKGRERIIKEHDYRHRLREIVQKMQEIYGV